MLRPLRLRCWTTQSIPAITWETSVAPLASASLRLTSRASGAMPRKWSSSPFWIRAGASLSRPAMIPAMWVPCPKVSLCSSSGTWALIGQVGTVDYVAVVQALDLDHTRVEQGDVNAPAGVAVVPVLAGPGDLLG